MSSLLRLLLAFLIVSGQVVFAAVTPMSVTAQNSISDEVLDELIVGLTTEGHAQAADVHNRAGGTLKRQAGLAPVQVVAVARNLAPSVQAAYARDRRVRFVEHNVRVRLAAVPTDPFFAQQWSLNRIAAPIAWDTSNGSAKVKIAIVDTGVDPNHPDLAGQIAATANFSTASDAIDRNGHGTHIAGTIAALTNN